MRHQIIFAIFLAISAPMILMAMDGGPVATEATESGAEAPDSPAVSGEAKPEKPAEAPEGSAESAKDEASDAEEQKNLSTGEMLGGMIEAGKAGKWVAFGGLVIMILVSAARRFSDRLRGKKWGYILAYGVPALAALGYSMSQGQFSFDVLIAAVMAGMAGGQIRKAGKDAANWVASRGS